VLRPTGEQQAILDGFATGADLVIQAGAGSGKTSTLKMIGERAGRRRGVYVAYNKAIANDAKRSFPSNITCATAHSFAYRAVGYRYKDRLNGPRLSAAHNARELGINAPLVIEKDLPPLSPQQIARIVLTTVGRFCRSADPMIEQRHVPQVKRYDSKSTHEALAREIAPLAQQAWADLSAPRGRLRFEHDHYLKLWQLSSPQLAGEFVLFDEAQDADPVIANVVSGQRRMQRIAVGDDAQSIYEWRGAINAMRGWNGIRLPLSRSFRFGNAIAREANKWLTLLDSPLRLRGHDPVDSHLATLAHPNAVLCRSNAGAMGEVLVALDRGQRPAIVGGAEPIRRLAEAAITLKEERGTDHPELFAFQTWAEVQDYAEHDQGGEDLRVLVKLIDQYKPEGIIAAVNQLADEDNADLVISTAHKSKGREWRTVRIGTDFPQPYRPRPDMPLEVADSEARLAYVAVTRAMQVLDRGGLAWVDQLVS
jgi:superfamily I DNA/RNA helicase